VERVALDLGEEFRRRDAHLVEVTAVAEVHAHRDHADVEPVELVVGDVGGRIGDDRHLAAGGVRGVLLPLHVVGLLAAHRAEARRDAEHFRRVR